MNQRIICIRKNPDLLQRAADYFSSRWDIDRELYVESMKDSISTELSIPQWYLMLRKAINGVDEIIGGFGLIENDFMVRTDLYPWLCALYIEPAERGNELGAKLLVHGCLEAARLGFGNLYLNTDHIGYYEKYGWRYIGDHAHQSGVDARVYKADALKIETSRLILRPFKESDAATASHNSRQPSVAHYMPDMVKESEEAALRWIGYVNKELFDVEKPGALFAIVRKTDGQCMGCIFINRKEEWGNVVEMGYNIADEYQNNGYATEAGKAMIRWAFEKAGQKELSAFVKPDNVASRRVIEKLGFIYEETRMLSYNGADCAFDYFRLCHTACLF